MILEMNGGDGEEQTAFEIAVVVPKTILKEKDDNFDCVEVLVKELKDVGFIVECVPGITNDFIKVMSFYFNFILVYLRISY